MKKIFSNKFVLFILGYVILAPFSLISLLFAGNFYATSKFIGELDRTPINHIIAYIGIAIGIIGIIISLKHKRLAFLYGLTTPFVLTSIIFWTSFTFKFIYPKFFEIISSCTIDLCHILPYHGDGLIIYPAIVCPIIAVVLLALSITFTIVFKTQKKKSADTAITD